jgi:hypothetical protein
VTDKLPGKCTEQQDTFARYVVKYGKKAIAYRKAYGDTRATPKSVWQIASHIAANPAVAARIEYYMGIARKKWQAEVEQIVEQLAKMMLVDKRDIYDEKGCILPPHEWPEHVAKTVAGIEVDEIKGPDGEIIGVTKKVTFEPRAAAAKILAVYRGMQVQRVEVGAPGEFDHLNDEQLEKALRAKLDMLDAIEKARSVTPKPVMKKKPQEES